MESMASNQTRFWCLIRERSKELERNFVNKKIEELWIRLDGKMW